MKTSRSRLLLIAAAVGLALVPAACGSGSEEPGSSAGSFSFRYAAQNPDTSTYGKQAQWWIDEVAKLTGNRVKFQTFYNSTLAGPTELLKTVKDGRVEFAHIPAGYYPSELPLSQVAGIPFVYSNTGDNTKALYTLYKESADFRSEWEEKHGLKVLAWAPNPNMALGSKIPLNSLADLQGKRLRVVGLSGKALQARGVEPVAMALPEVYEALKRGVLDGWSGLPLSLATTVGVTEVAKYVFDTGIGSYTAVPVVVVKLAEWNKIPKDVQDAMVAAGERSVDVGLQITQDLEKAGCDDLLTAKQGKVTRISDSDLATWKADVQDDVVAQWISDVGKAGVTDAVARKFYEAYAAAVGKSGSTYAEGMVECAKRSS
jgi:TRAP-type C4-dicarboxylate transport system substrate-binding protein